MVNKFTKQPTIKEVVPKINEVIDAVNSASGNTTDVQINGTSITSNNVANIITKTAYNSSSNKIATVSDVPTKLSELTDDLGSSPTHTHSQYISSHQTIKQDGVTGATVNRFCQCNTIGSVVTKIASVSSGSWSLEEGARITVKFKYANTADNPQLKVNSGTAKNIFYKGSQITTGSNKSLLSGTVDFVYDGTQYHLVGNCTDTTYSSGNGITIDVNNAINHSNAVTAGTAGTSSATSGSTLAVPYVTYDAQGHITTTGTHTHTVTGFLTSISSSDVTTALGYTPYNSTNPNGYTSNIGTVTKVNNTSPDSNGNVSLTIPTVNNGTLTIQKNGTTVKTFTANSSSNVTCNITVPTNTNELTNGAGFITGIGSADVINALGYTPYSASNPNGYTSNIGTVTKVNNTSPDSSGNVTLSIPTVDQTYNASSSNAQSGVAIAGAGFLKNTATGSNALTIGGTASAATSALNIGLTSTAGGGYSVAVGYYAASNGARTTSIGYGARIGGSTADAIQIGNGTNSTAKSLSIGFYNTGNYQLLDGTTGLIPLDRISVMGGAGASSAGTKGLVPAPASGDNTKFLRGDGTWQTVSGGGSGANIDLSNLSATGEAHFLKNTSSYNYALGILGAANADSATSIGYGSAAGQHCTALGKSAIANGSYAIQIGEGTNTTSNSLYFGFENNNYQLLDGSTGLIPDARISTNIARTSQIPSTSAFEQTSNKVTSISSSSTDTQYPSAKSVIELLKTIYPVGSVYLSTNSTCPMASLFGTWTLVSSGKALWTGNGNNGNTTIAQSLPNITGGWNGAKIGNYTSGSNWGAFTITTANAKNFSEASSSSAKPSEISFSANNSSTIYSTTNTIVQPPAYVVNVWKRTA